MTRLRRCEFHGAIHLVTLGGYAGGNVFYAPQVFTEHSETLRCHAPDAEYFENLLWDTCEQYNACVHAYFLEPNVASVIIQTLGAPLGWIMHDLLTRYSMYLRRQSSIPEWRKPFASRYKTQIVQPGKLPYAVRYVHRREVAGAPLRRAINHPFSSNLIYCGRKASPKCFLVTATQNALARLGYPGQSSYFEFMAVGDTPSIAHMLSRHVIGEKVFADSIGERCRTRVSVPSPDEILREVTSRLLHAAPEVACSLTHKGAFARALIAWYAMRTGAAQITAVARWFGVTSSDLRYLIRQHRQRHPQHFSKALPELFPILFTSKDAVLAERTDDLRRPGTSENPPVGAPSQRMS